MDTNHLQQALENRIARLGPDRVLNLIDSNFHDNGFFLPEAILRQGFSDYLDQRSYHPDSRGALPARQAIADWYQQPGWAEVENIILTASSSEAYNLLFQAFSEPGDNVLLPLPAYPLFEDIAGYNHLETRFYSLNEATGWQPELDILDSLADSRTRFLVLISPNNPCGSVISDTLLHQILGICQLHQIMVISDEVFSEFLYDLPHLPRVAQANASLTDSLQVPVFTINGISKMFACPDLKLSWIICSGPRKPLELPSISEIVRELELRNDTFLNCNSFSQFLLPKLFQECQPFIKGMVVALTANRQGLATILLPQLPAGVRLVLPEGGIHCLIAFSAYQIADDEQLAISLLDYGLYLHPGYLYGMDDEPCLVMSLLKNTSDFLDGITRLAEALDVLI